MQFSLIRPWQNNYFLSPYLPRGAVFLKGELGFLALISLFILIRGLQCWLHAIGSEISHRRSEAERFVFWSSGGQSPKYVMKPSNWRKFKSIWITLVRCWMWSSLLKFYLSKPFFSPPPSLEADGFAQQLWEFEIWSPRRCRCLLPREKLHSVVKPHLKRSHRVATS